MSINYHAYQSRGFLFTDFEIPCEQWRTRFTAYDPQRVAGILNLAYDETYLYLSYLKDNYRLCLEQGILEKKQDSIWTDQVYFNEAMSIYHLLHYVKDIPLHSGIWIPNENLDTRRGSRRVNDILLQSFSAKFTGKCKELKSACETLSGKPLSKGDAAYEFEVFEQIHVQLVFWDKDEDFEAQTQIFVDSCVTDYVHIETTGCIVSDLLEKLEQCLKLDI